MKRILFVLLIVMLTFSVVACSVEATKNSAMDASTDESGAYPSGYSTGDIASSGSGKTGFPARDGYAIKDAYGDVAYDGYMIAPDGDIGMVPVEGDDGELNGEPTPRAGLLTACAYADWEYNAFWQGLLTSDQQGEGKFAGFFQQFAFKALKQVKVTVEGIAGAKVTLIRDEEILSTARTNNAGVAYLFAPSGSVDGLTVKAEVKDAEGEVLSFSKTVENDEAVFTREEMEGAAEKQFDRIEVMFVIDTTGSMGDEIRYLKEEISDVIGRIKAETGADVLLAIMVYRDEGDDYVTRYSDFTTDIAKQQEFLSKQDAAGGGDFEEAVDQALTEAVEKQWTTNATKLIVHVADAPAHDDVVGKWQQAAATAAENGIRIVSVASSGIDSKTEYFFRSQSLMTNGAYIWLTDDSGIGGGHLEATVEHRPEVEALNDCLVRVMKGLHEGSAITLPAPTPQEEQPEEVKPEEGQEQQPQDGEIEE